MPSSLSDGIPKNGREREPTASEEYLKKILNQESDFASVLCEGEKCLRKATVESVEIEGDGLMIGENFGSSMIYATVKYLVGNDHKEMGIVIKNLKETPWHVEVMNIFVLFEKEVNFFRTTFPAIDLFQSKRRVTRRLKELLPKCLYAHTEKGKGIVITENICEKGFKMADRRRGLGLRHATLAMKALAQFHAASLTMKILEPEIFRTAIQATRREAYFTEERAAMFDKLYKQISKGRLIPMAQAEAEKGSADGASLLKTAEIGEAILRNRGLLAIKILENYQEPLAVLNHGDFWVNNFMYRYDTDKHGKKIPVSMKLLDFQMTRYGSPALDILTFLYTSTTEQLRRDHEEELLQAYHRSLIDSIFDAGIDPMTDVEYDGKEKVGKVTTDDKYKLPEKHPFSIESLKNDLKRHGPWAFMIGEMMLRIIKADSSEAAEAMEATLLNGTEEPEEDKMIGYEMLQQLNTKEFYKCLFQVLKELNRKDYLKQW